MDQQVAELDFYQGNDQTMDEFNRSFEKILSEARTTGNHGRLRQARDLMYRQMMFLMRRWMEESPYQTCTRC